MSAASVQDSCSSPSRPAPFGFIEIVGNHPVDRGTSRIPARLVNFDSDADDSRCARLQTSVSSLLAVVFRRPPPSTLELSRPEMNPLDLLISASLSPYLSICCVLAEKIILKGGSSWLSTHARGYHSPESHLIPRSSNGTSPISVSSILYAIRLLADLF